MRKLFFVVPALVVLCVFLSIPNSASLENKSNIEQAATTYGPAAGKQQQPQISKGNAGSLVVWSDNRSVITRSNDSFSDEAVGSGFDIYAARYDANGNPIDTAPLVINEAIRDQTMPHVAWNGQNWFVAWITVPVVNQYQSHVVGVRVSPEGKILDAAPIVIGRPADSTASGGANYIDVESDGTNWIVAWGTGGYESTINAARITPEGVLLDTGGQGKILYDDEPYFTAPFAVDIAHIGNQIMIVWEALNGIRAKRLNSNLDSTDAVSFKVNLVANSDANAPHIATDGTNYFVTWIEDRFAYTEIFGARISQNGQVLDQNGILLSGINTNYTFPGSSSLCFDGVNYVAAFHSRTGGLPSVETIKAVKVSPAGAVLTQTPIAVSDQPSWQPAIAQLSNGVSQAVWTDNRLNGTEGDIFTSVISADNSVSANAAASLGAPRETQPRIAFTNTGSFALIHRSTVSGESGVLFQRFDANGNALDANPVVVVKGAEILRNPSLAWNGSVYLVVWELNTQIFGRRVSADGVPLGDAFPIMPGNQPDVAALGSQFLVVDDYEPTNHIRFAQSIRVDGDGNVLGSPLKIGSNYDVRPRVRAFGNRWLVIWEKNVTHDNTNSSIVGAFVNTDGTSQGAFGISSSDADAPSLAIAGDTALIVWEGYNTPIYGRRMKADGTLLDTAQGILIANSPKSLYAPYATWDGARFIVTYNDMRNSSLEPPDDVWATLVGLDGSVITPGGFAVAKSSLPEEHQVIEAANGISVFGYAMFEDKAPFSNYRIRLRRFPFDSNFFITTNPYARTIAPGGTTTYSISVNSLNGFNQPVALDIIGLPGGVTATFAPQTVSNSNGSSTLTITSNPDTPQNIYRLTVTATSGIQQSNSEIVLYVDTNPPPVGYSIVNLGTLGGIESEARAINNNGQVVGHSLDANNQRRAFLYANNQMQSLGTLGGNSSQAEDINDSGLVVGTAKNSAGKDRAFLYNGSTMQDLGTFGGSSAGAAGINNSNQIAGYATVDTENYHAFIYQNNQLQDLGLINGFYSYGRAINNTGKVVGLAYQDGEFGGGRAFIYQNGTMSPIAPVDGRENGAEAINDSDQVVGSSSYTPNAINRHAFLYTNGQIRDLGTLGGAQSFAYDINNAGQVVGSIEFNLFSRDYRAFLYDGTTMRNLNTLIPQDSGWVLSEAFGINNNGQIVGRGLFNSQIRAFLLNPTGSQNTPPAVQITTPAPAARFAESNAITINAAAEDADGIIARVEFYADGNLIGVQTSAPYALLWSGMQVNRTYTLTARAVDDRGAATVSAPVTVTIGTPSVGTKIKFDFDGDNKADVSVYRNGVWYLQNSTTGFAAVQFGIATDRIAPADYDGDGKTDIAVYRDGVWYILQSRDGVRIQQFGVAEDKPQPGDYDGDGKADLVVYRPSTQIWYLLQSTNGFSAFQFGLAEDKPVAEDYDGDGKTDIAVYRPSTGVWYLQRSRDGFIALQFGVSTDKPVPTDYDGDEKADVAVYRDGVWYVLKSTGGVAVYQFGVNTDTPVPADYDGDGKNDYAVFRSGVWWMQLSASGTVRSFQFGLPGDIPVPSFPVQ